MPVQRVLFGRPLPPMPPRRIMTLLGTIAIFAVFTLIFTLPSSIPEGPSLGSSGHRSYLPKLPHLAPSFSSPFGPTAHAPPVIKNTTDGESKWYNNWNWLSPFSSSVTLDEDRSILPPLIERPAIYTYYDHTQEKDEGLKDAEDILLLTWRKAWWAQGFKPIILSPNEAMNNPLYVVVQQLDLQPTMKVDLYRWLAWENMGTGLLCNYLTLPMGSYEDPLISYLRRGEYPRLTRYEKFGAGLFSGAKADVTAVIKQILELPQLKVAVDIVSSVSPETFQIDAEPASLAYYSPATIAEKYPAVAKAIAQDDASGWMLLNKLTIAHLHSTWQNIFSKGINVVKPHPLHMSGCIEPAMVLAEFLSQCPESPMISSCPPNRPNCKPCVSSHPLQVVTPESYRNTSGLYTIGTVPHPFTMAVLIAFRDDINVAWIRRESERDPWLYKLTKETLGTGVSGAPRVVKFKEAVASEHGRAHSLWITPEKPLPSDLDWHFGFTIPRNVTDRGIATPPVPKLKEIPLNPFHKQDGPVPNQEDAGRELALLRRAQEFARSRSGTEEKLSRALEAWHLADTEAWKFARAFLARSRMERLKWEEEEMQYAGGAGAERGRKLGWGRWLNDKA